MPLVMEKNFALFLNLGAEVSHPEIGMLELEKVDDVLLLATKDIYASC